MNIPLKLASFAGALGIAFGGAALTGAALDPTSTDVRAPDTAAMAGGHGGTSSEGGQSAAGAEHPAAGRGEAPGGLAVSEGGYTLRVPRTSVPARTPTRFEFSITDDQGRPVRTGYELESERELHLVVVRRDVAVFEHLHPTRDAAGTWSTQLVLPEAGVYRAYADFAIGGLRHTLATDLFVPGEFRPDAFPPASNSASTDGYTVTLASHGVASGAESRLAFRVERAGLPAADLQPYLGAKGHLVALREGDLAYLHVHPDAAEAAPEEIAFAAEFPSPGRYRLFLQFQTDGRVHTAAYTLEVSG